MKNRFKPNENPLKLLSYLLPGQDNYQKPVNVTHKGGLMQINTPNGIYTVSYTPKELFVYSEISDVIDKDNLSSKPENGKVGNLEEYYRTLLSESETRNLWLQLKLLQPGEFEEKFLGNLGSRDKVWQWLGEYEERGFPVKASMRDLYPLFTKRARRVVELSEIIGIESIEFKLKKIPYIEEDVLAEMQFAEHN